MVIIMLRAIWDFKEFDLIFLLTGGGPVISTQTLPLLVYKEAFALNQMGMASAYAVMMMLIMLVFMIVYIRRTGAEALMRLSQRRVQHLRLGLVLASRSRCSGWW